MNAHTRDDTCVAPALVRRCTCTHAPQRASEANATKTPRNWLEEASKFSSSFSRGGPTSLSRSRRCSSLKIIPTFTGYKSARPLFRETDPLTDHRRHRTPARYPLTRLEPGLLTAGTASLASPVSAGISKPLDRKDEIAGEIQGRMSLPGSVRAGKEAETATTERYHGFLPYRVNTECVSDPSPVELYTQRSFPRVGLLDRAVLDCSTEEQTCRRP